jgi:uncharacterized protein (DUF2126 family)
MEGDRRAREQVDADLVANDVRLTQGGEPTFVSIDDMDGAEWNYTALSPAKRKLGEILIKRLKKKFAPEGFLHYGQGKWYPGEPLPRWALGVFWRTDGVALWQGDALIADTTKPGAADVAQAKAFGERIAATLGLPATQLITAYEDVPRFLHDEAALPRMWTRSRPILAKPDERARLARLLMAGLGSPAGFVLPLKATVDDHAEIRWESSPWPLKREHLYAVPGDSPLGLRLPLSSLPELLPDEADPEFPVDPFAPREALPGRNALDSKGAKVRGRKPRGGHQDGHDVTGARGAPARIHATVREARALCGVARGRRGHSARTGDAVIIEGYAPPATRESRF